GSGHLSKHPWGYRRFSSMQAFRRYLRQNRLENLFLRYQRDPEPSTGRYFATRYVNSTQQHVILMAVSESRVSVVDEYSKFGIGPHKRAQYKIHGDRCEKSAARIVDMMHEFRKLGFHRAIVSVQCFDCRGVLQPFDFNLRTSPSFDLLAR